MTPVAGRAELEVIALDLLSSFMPVRKGVRLLGVTLSSLGAPDDHDPQMKLAL